MSECNMECSSCSAGCGEEKKMKREDFWVNPHQFSDIKKVIAVISGKGGVGKSFVTSIAACAMRKKGYNCAIMDADITGPSIPRLFGIKGQAVIDELGVYPAETPGGLKIMSVNLMVRDETDPVIWRGPIVAGTVKQFWTDVIWGEVDYMFVDMPPGTGDVPLTVFQNIPLDGVIIVSSPQDVVNMVVSKAVRMARMMEVPILGIVENMSYFHCPDNGKDYKIFGESNIELVADKFDLELIARIPIDSELCIGCDKGRTEKACDMDMPWAEKIADVIAEKVPVMETAAR